MHIYRHLREKLQNSLQQIGLQTDLIDFERPKDIKHGDISTNLALNLSKSTKKNPRELAQQIIENLSIPDEFIQKAEIAGPGFINFFITENYYRAQLKSQLEEGEHYGRSVKNEGKTANVEWVSANPTGPLHAGHGRHIALGKAISDLLEWMGYKVTREYYYNDAGRQMENLANSVYARYMQLFDPSYKLPDDAYAGEYIITLAQLINEQYGNKLRNTGDREIFKTAGENWCFKSIKHTLQRMGIEHDEFFNETSLYVEGKIKETLNVFKEKGLSYEKDGAVWLKTSQLLEGKKETEDKVIVKSTDEPTYRLPDMAYHVDKIKRGYDLIVDIFGSDHADTYKEVLAGVRGLGYDTSNIKVILHQMVTFVQNGKPVRMSKRSDNVYYLDDLLDDVGADVAQFFFVMRGANTHLDFDVSLAKEQSEKNPVFYLQYAHARICSILRNVNEVFPDYRNIDNSQIDINLLKQPEEIDLMKSLSYFPWIVENAAETYEPHKIINYLNEVAERYHRFYHNHRVIIQGEKTLSFARLKLCEAVKVVLKNGFEIIGISAPERM